MQTIIISILLFLVLLTPHASAGPTCAPLRLIDGQAGAGGYAPRAVCATIWQDDLPDHVFATFQWNEGNSTTTRIRLELRDDRGGVLWETGFSILQPGRDTWSVTTPYPRAGYAWWLSEYRGDVFLGAYAYQTPWAQQVPRAPVTPRLWLPLVGL